MLGYYNMIVRIDVTERSFVLEPVSDEILASRMGGKGLGAHLLLDHNPPGVAPLSPENLLIFAGGAATGTAVWGSCRYGVFTKSPQTGFFSESYSGGTVAEYLAATGFDAIAVRGSSETPLWIEISEDAVYFHDATDLWGLSTYETEDRVKAWLAENRTGGKNSGVITIGPAGENKVSFAVIENDYWRSAGRTGVGAVMGSKGIKAVAFRGNRQKEIAAPEAVKSFAKKMALLSRTDAGVKAYKTNGTPMLVDIMNNVGGFPSRYWHEGVVTHREQINAAALHSRCEVKSHACLKCYMACGRLSTVKAGRHKGLTIEGPEYETIYAFGGLCEVDSIEEIAYLNDLCDSLGMDTITAGNLVGLTIEAGRQGKISRCVDYGEVDNIARLLQDIAYRRGMGEILARGIIAAAKEFNMEDQAIHVKGLEPAGYDPRVLKGMGLAYGTSPRGACHLRATFYKPELSNMIDPEQIEGKAAMFVEWEDRLTFFDTLILCRFYRDQYQWEELAEMVKGLTGQEFDKQRMSDIARTVSDDVRRFNIREGLTSADDQLPKRFHSEALPETQKIITEKQMSFLLKDYYKARGWDEDGRPFG
ncbi:MAG: aldehyde ferredoxin oxidoreductase family protein [Deltaproteobacteria bacterium]|nr:aldehyde ferredoxin oxidoreductase family protein [Candidatus Anaeroferrophillus wilburensis]MBN2889013.1 aldehyde ferredoxin oxidoreductase family protein [Deltaproteobacteria bacterium]